MRDYLNDQLKTIFVDIDLMNPLELNEFVELLKVNIYKLFDYYPFVLIMVEVQLMMKLF